MTFNPEDLGKIRFQLRLYPGPGVGLSAREASEYSIRHRFLDASEMARRMVEVNNFLKIFEPESKINTIENWLGDIIRSPEWLERSNEIQHGIFFMRKDAQFPGGIRVFADIGTILDGSIYGDQG